MSLIVRLGCYENALGHTGPCNNNKSRKNRERLIWKCIIYLEAISYFCPYMNNFGLSISMSKRVYIFVEGDKRDKASRNSTWTSNLGPPSRIQYLQHLPSHNLLHLTHSHSSSSRHCFPTIASKMATPTSSSLPAPRSDLRIHFLVSEERICYIELLERGYSVGAWLLR
jgi:hypothetical protein